MKNDHGRNLTGSEMAGMLEEFANGAGKKEIQAFAAQIVLNTHPTIQQKVMGMFVACIELWAEAKGDARNEATRNLCKKFCEATDKYNRFLPLI